VHSSRKRVREKTTSPATATVTTCTARGRITEAIESVCIGRRHEQTRELMILLTTLRRVSRLEKLTYVLRVMWLRAVAPPLRTDYVTERYVAP